MNNPDDIDFYFTLDNHGWSICYLNIEGAIYSMRLTHVFDNPIDVLLDALISILLGKDQAEFKWHDEPGEYDWGIERLDDDKNKVGVTITNCFHINSPDELQPSANTLEFEVKLKLFCICILKQMEKIRDLMADKDFNENRRNQFPHKTFKEFKIAYERKFS